VLIQPSCDVCDKFIEGTVYKACTTRPSDPRALVSVMWACVDCQNTIGGHPDSYWEQYAEENNLDYEG
jgi:hypothetical protein